MQEQEFSDPITRERVYKTRPQDSGAITAQLTSKETIRLVDDILRGYERDEDGILLNPKTAVPVCSEDFRRLAINILTNALSTNVILSNFNQLEVDDQAHMIMDSVLDYITMNPTCLEESVRDTIVSILDAQVYAALKRAFLGLERETARAGQTESSESRVIGNSYPQPAQEKKGFFAFLRGRS